MPRVALALSIALVLALAACGGDDETTTVEAGASTSEEDTEAIESLIVDWGLTDDPAQSCALISGDFLARLGGLDRCTSEVGDPEQFTVEEVNVAGDTASVIVVREDGQQVTAPVVREGEPGDLYGGWKIAAGIDRWEPVPDPGEETQPPATTAPEAEGAPQTPQEKADAYAACVEARGAQDIKRTGGERPQVDFSGGGSRINAVFATSVDDARAGYTAISKDDRVEFFLRRVGTIVLFTVGDPLADDLNTGIACAEQTG